VLALVLAWASGAGAQSGPGGPSPRFLVAVGGGILFAHYAAGDGGWQLWHTDGTSAGTALVASDLGDDVEMERRGDGSEAFVAVRGALAATDGTSAGTRVVAALDFFPTAMNEVGGILYFSDGNGGLWRSDGTAAGTTQVLDIPPGVSMHDVTPAAITDGPGTTLYFRASDAASGSELWRSDGTGPGTMPVADINAIGGSFPSSFTVLNGIVYFSADDGVHGIELWRSDGTTPGTWMVADLNPLGDSTPSGFVDLGGQLVFTADDGTGSELWRTDGTGPGTMLLADINPGGASSPSAFRRIGEVIYFRADDGLVGSELWRTNGTPAGTVRVADLAAPGSSFPRNLRNAGGILIFTADDGVHGEEMWRSDGTGLGTVRVSDVDPGGSSAPRDLVVVADVVYFVADDGATGEQLFALRGCGSTGSAATCAVEQIVLPFTSPPAPSRPELVRDIRAGGAGSAPTELTPLLGEAVFAARTDAAGTELWRTDATGVGTLLVRDILPGPGDSSPAEFVALGGTVFFRANDGTGSELWRTDGTPAGTIRVRDIAVGGSSTPELLKASNGLLYFRANDGVHGQELWRSDGTAAGTQLVRDINPAGDSAPRGLTPLGGALLFSADDGTGRRLWRTDGNTTSPIWPDAGLPPEWAPAWLLPFAGKVFFTAGDAEHGVELFASDGTPAGTTLVQDMAPGPTSSAPAQLTAAGGRLYLNADTPGLGREPWRSDGTAVGTALLADLRAGPAGSEPQRFVDVGGRTFFVANDGTFGWEIWTTNGTGPGTAVLRDIDPTNVTVPSFLTGLGNRLYFSAFSPGFGRELWVSDGTPAGTRLVVDLNSGGNANPESLVVRGGSLLFAANDGALGDELWSLSVCGDGVRGFREPCDDGNRTDGDGCSAQCTVEIPPCSGSETCIGGKRMRINGRKGLSLTLDTRDLAIIPGAPGSATDPTAVGVVLELADLGGTVAVRLPLEAAGWKAKSKAGAGYRFRSSGDTRCRVKLGVGRLRVQCRQAVGSQVAIDGPVAVRVRFGDALTYCLEFERESPGLSTTRWRAREAVAPLQCPEILPVSP
jgi:ELWxxDGT repeat protein/cysteine-rich repeat protein